MRWNDLPTAIEGLRLASADVEVCLAVADALLAYGLVRAGDTFVGVQTSRGELVVPSGHPRVMDFVMSEQGALEREPDQGEPRYEGRLAAGVRGDRGASPPSDLRLDTLA